MNQNLLLGVVLSLAGALFYSTQTALVKLQAIALPPLPVVIFIQSLVALLIMLPFILKKGRAHALKIMTTRNTKLHLMRTIFSLSISYLLFYAVTFMPLVNAMLLANTAPFIVPFMGYLFLSQKINHRLWVPVLIGFAGVAIVLHPDARILNPAALLALGAAVGMAASLLTVRRLAVTEATETTMFYFFLFSTILSGVLALAFWSPISMKMLLEMIGIGALYFLTQYATTAAMKYANPQLVGSLFYSNIIYAAIISLFLWNIFPTASTLAGMVLIILGGILCIRVERSTKIRVNHVK
jgi:drug/metabolite transporter (DMT)-like permease